MGTRAICEGIVRLKLETATLAVALALADARKQTLDEYFSDLVSRDARSLTKRTGEAVEWRHGQQSVQQDAGANVGGQP
jgi:hypothetical protein